jgi:phosphate transport system substrate-binding protein
MLPSGRHVPGAARRGALAAAVLAAAVFAPRADAEAQVTVRIGGTGAALGGMRLLAQAYTKAHPDTRIVILPSLGSHGGVKALLAGKIDLALSVEPPNGSAQAAQLVTREYARTPLVFATHRDTPAGGITLEQLARAYTGSMTAWSDGTRLRLIKRPAVDTDTRILRAMSTDLDKAVEAATWREDLLTATTDQDNAAALEEIRGSLGLITLAQMLSERRQLKPLAVDGAEGTLEALREGKYPYAKNFFIIARPSPAPEVAAFLQFVDSTEGRQILTQSGHLPGAGRARSGP